MERKDKMANWLEIIEDNRGKLQEVAEQAFRDAMGNRHMRFIVEVREDGECFSWGDVAGGNSQTATSWKGESYQVGEFCFQYMDIPITEKDLREHMTREEQAQAEAKAEEYGDSFLGYVLSECPDVVEKCEKKYLADYTRENAAEEAESLIDRRIEELKQEETEQRYWEGIL